MFLFFLLSVFILSTTLDHLYKQSAPRGSAHTHTHTRSNPQLAVRLLEANNCCMKTIAAAAEVVAAVVVAAVVVVAWH